MNCDMVGDINETHLMNNDWIDWMHMELTWETHDKLQLSGVLIWNLSHFIC